MTPAAASSPSGARRRIRRLALPGRHDRDAAGCRTDRPSGPAEAVAGRARGRGSTEPSPSEPSPAAGRRRSTSAPSSRRPRSGGRGRPALRPTAGRPKAAREKAGREASRQKADKDEKSDRTRRTSTAKPARPATSRPTVASSPPRTTVGAGGELAAPVSAERSGSPAGDAALLAASAGVCTAGLAASAVSGTTSGPGPAWPTARRQRRPATSAADGDHRSPSEAATRPAPGRLVDVGARAGRGSGPHHQPLAAGPHRAGRVGHGAGSSHRRALGDVLPALPPAGRRRGAGPGGVPGAARRRLRRDRPARPARDPAAVVGGRDHAARSAHAGGAAGRRSTTACGWPTIIICVGAANSLANPRKLLASLPPALYEVGTAVVIAFSLFPQLAESVQRVRRARRLRGDAGRGIRALRRIVVPVLEDALDRSVALAASMDSRGYGRRGTASAPPPRHRGPCCCGLLGLCVGAYAFLDSTAPRVLAWPMLAAGLAAGGHRFRGRRTRGRAHPYRPARWLPAEVLTAACGVGAAALMSLAARDLAVVLPGPATFPPLSPLAAVASSGSCPPSPRRRRCRPPRTRAGRPPGRGR